MCYLSAITRQRNIRMGNNVSFSTRVRGEPGRRGIEDDSEYQRTSTFVQDARREGPPPLRNPLRRRPIFQGDERTDADGRCATSIWRRFSRVAFSPLAGSLVTALRSDQSVIRISGREIMARVRQCFIAGSFNYLALSQTGGCFIKMAQL